MASHVGEMKVVSLRKIRATSSVWKSLAQRGGRVFEGYIFLLLQFACLSSLLALTGAVCFALAGHLWVAHRPAVIYSHGEDAVVSACFISLCREQDIFITAKN